MFLYVYMHAVICVQNCKIGVTAKCAKRYEIDVMENWLAEARGGIARLAYAQR